MKTGIIYEWRNKLDDKFYVGQTIHPKVRYNDHLKAQGDSLFHRAIRKYGIENFEYSVVATYEHETEQGLYDLLNEAEKERIKLRNSIRPNGYNVAEGGKNGNTLAGLTEEEYKDICRKNSEAVKQYYIDHPEKRDELSKKARGRKHSAATRAKMSKNNAFKNNPELAKKHGEKLKGRPAHNKGKKSSAETCAKLSERFSGENNPMYGKNPEDFMTPETIEVKNKKISKSMKGMKFVNNGTIQIRIHESKIDEFLENNPEWVRGILKSTKRSECKKGTHRVYHEDGTFHMEKNAA